MYLYMHVSPSGRKYIGITQQEPQERWRNGKGYPRNKHFQNAIKKYGWENFEHIILFDDLTEDEANEYEEELIDLFDTTNPQKGYNLHTGGRHHKVSQESRDKLSKALKGKYAGKNNPFYGKHHTEKTKSIIREKNKTKVAPTELLEYKQKQREQLPKVVQIDKETGEIVATWDNWCVAGRVLVKEHRLAYAHISECCKGKRKSAYGYRWQLAEAWWQL